VGGQQQQGHEPAQAAEDRDGEEGHLEAVEERARRRGVDRVSEAGATAEARAGGNAEGGADRVRAVRAKCGASAEGSRPVTWLR